MPNVDLFSIPETQISTESSEYTPFLLSSTITNNGPYQFSIPPDPAYISLTDNYLYLKVKLTKADGSPINGEQIEASVINLFGKGFIKQVKVFINGKLASDSGPLYAYRAFLESELNYSGEAKKDLLACALYQKDGTSQINTVLDPGWLARGAHFVGSNTVETIGRVHSDIFQGDRLMLNNTKIDLQIFRNSDEFLIHSFTQEAYKIEVVDMIFYVKKVHLTPSLDLAIQNTLLKNPAKYPIKRIEVSKLSVTGGRMQAPTTTIVNGQLPNRIIIGFVATNSLFGSYSTTPFSFQNFNIREIYLTVGGKMVPSTPYICDFGANIFKRSYFSLLNSLDLGYKSVDISPEDYYYNRCLFTFDLTPDDTDNYWTVIKQGSVTCHCQFDRGVPNGIEMLIYTEYNNLFMIDRHRSIYYDFSA